MAVEDMVVWATVQGDIGIKRIGGCEGEVLNCKALYVGVNAG
jgi:hypothetical protein